MRYFIDSEFIEDGRTIDLVSIGIVAEDGRELYCEVDGVDWAKASQWVLDNVRPHLWSVQADKTQFNKWSRDGGVGGLLSREHIATEVRRFCDPAQHGCLEFWGYFASYDWVVLCQLFGTMMDLPEGWPYFVHDLRQWLNHKELHGVSQPDDAPHNALADARWVAETYGELA